MLFTFLPHAITPTHRVLFFYNICVSNQPGFCLFSASLSVFWKQMDVFSFFYYTLLACMIPTQKGRLFEAVLIGKQIRYTRRIKEINQESLAKQVGGSTG